MLRPSSLGMSSDVPNNILEMKKLRKKRRLADHRALDKYAVDNE